MKKKQPGVKAAAIIILLMIAAVLLGSIFRNSLFPKREEGENRPDEEPVIHESIAPDESEGQSVRAALKTCDVYRLDDLDFAFAIAILKMHAPSGETVTLDHFHTDEGIYLNETGEYVKALEEHSYWLGRRNVMFSLVSVKEDYEAAVFIPVISKEKETLTLICDLEGIEDMTLRLDQNVITDGESLYAEKGGEQTLSDDATYSMRVSSALDITDEMFYVTDPDGNRMQYVIPSANRVYAMQIDVRLLADDSVVITDAEFIPEGYESGFHAMNGSIRSMKETNIIGRSIQEEDRGFLFFEVFGPEYSPVTYRGVLLLSLEGKDEPLSIQVDLN